MTRTLWIAVLGTGCIGASDARLDGVSSDPELSLDAYVGYLQCDDGPCTSLELDVRRGDALVGADVMASADGEAPVRITVAASGIHQFAGTIPHWIHHVRIDVDNEGATAALWADSILTTPFDAGASVPDPIVSGSQAALSWSAQGTPVSASIIFTRATVPQAFGFLEALGPDDGRFDLGPTFDAPGHYNIALHREVTHEYDGDAKLSLLWTSDWQQPFDVVEPPPI